MDVYESHVKDEIAAIYRNSEKRKHVQLKRKEYNTESEDKETRNPRNNDLSHESELQKYLVETINVVLKKRNGAKDSRQKGSDLEARKIERM